MLHSPALNVNDEVLDTLKSDVRFIIHRKIEYYL